ncbi:MAG: tRNA-binding protein, partial [Glaciecola sp.]
MGQHQIDPGARPYDPATAERKPTVDAASLFALDLRVGVVIDVQPFAEARKPALKVTVDFGALVGTLTTSAQITNYGAQELLGREIVGVVNLPAKRIAG